MPRHDSRQPDQLRSVMLTRGWLDHAEGSCLVEFGRTRVLVAASAQQGVPRWRKGSGLGWVTAEYAMLPRATHTRSDRESVKGRLGGRTHEISRLVGRSLRASIDLSLLGESTIAIDCDVLQADGGTRTAAITGACVALADACAHLGRPQAMVRSPSALRSNTVRMLRPISRWISCVRPLCLPRAASRSLRVCVLRGSMPYSAVTQPSPLPRLCGGTFSSTEAVQSTWVSPKATSTEPSACRV